MNRRDFLKATAIVPLFGLPAVSLVASGSIMSADFLNRTHLGCLLPDKAVLPKPAEPELPCFDFLDEMEAPYIVTVAGDDSHLRTLVAHAIAKKIHQKRFTMLYDPWFPLKGEPPLVPVTTAWQNNWMSCKAVDGGLLRSQMCTAWYQNMLRECANLNMVAVTVTPTRQRYRHFGDDECYCWGHGWMLCSSFAIHVMPDPHYPEIIAARVLKNRLPSRPRLGDALHFRDDGGRLIQIDRTLDDEWIEVT